MLTFLLYYLVYIGGVAYVGYVMSKFLNYKFISKRSLALGVILSMLVCTAWYKSFGFEANGIFFITVLLMTFFYFKGKFFDKLIAFLLMVLASIIVETFVLLIMTHSLKFDYSSFNETILIFYQINVVIGELILIAVYAFLVKLRLLPYKIPLDNQKRFIKLVYFVLSCSGILYVSEINDLLRSILTSQIIVSVELIFSTLVMSFIFVGGLFLVLQLKSNEKALDSKNTLLEKHLNHQLKHYQQLEHNLIETHKIKHDMVNLMSCLKILIEGEDKAATLALLNQIEDKVNTITKTLETGNNVVDAILNEKAQEAASHGINLVFEGSLPKHEFIDWIDLCTIIANSVDNAIEAVKHLPTTSDRTISIKSFIKKGHWVYFIKNPSSLVEIGDNQILETSKSDKQQHGFGLMNIRDSVENYNGEMCYTCENNEFKLNVVIHLVK